MSLNTFMLNFAKPRERSELPKKLENYKRYERTLAPPKEKRRREVNSAKKKLTRAQIKELGLYAISHDALKYRDALKLHKLWCGYISNYIDSSKLPDVTKAEYNNVVTSLLKADYHGAKISIVRSKQSSVVGMKGIVILDTKGTFKMVSKDDKIRTIPKADSLFEVHFGDVVIAIFGKFLNFRPADRAVKKTKVLLIPEL